MKCDKFFPLILSKSLSERICKDIEGNFNDFWLKKTFSLILLFSNYPADSDVIFFISSFLLLLLKRFPRVSLTGGDYFLKRKTQKRAKKQRNSDSPTGKKQNLHCQFLEW